MSSDENMPFEMPEDPYDTFRHRKGPSKEQRTYGIWSKNDDNEKTSKTSKTPKNDLNDDISSDDDMLMRAGFNPLAKEVPGGAKKKPKFMNFVSAGLIQGKLKKGTEVVSIPAENKVWIAEQKKIKEDKIAEEREAAEAAKREKSGKTKSNADFRAQFLAGFSKATPEPAKSVENEVNETEKVDKKVHIGPKKGDPIVIDDPVDSTEKEPVKLGSKKKVVCQSFVGATEKLDAQFGKFDKSGIAQCGKTKKKRVLKQKWVFWVKTGQNFKNSI